MSAVVEEINDKHMTPWAELCQVDDTEHTPLTPYMDEELLRFKHLNVSNQKLKDFRYDLRVPRVTREKIEEVIHRYLTTHSAFIYMVFSALPTQIVNDFIEQKLLPRSLMY